MAEIYVKDQDNPRLEEDKQDKGHNKK